MTALENDSLGAGDPDNNYDDGGDYGSSYASLGVENLLLVESFVCHLSPVLIIFGTVGNLVAMVILHRLSHEVMSSCVYLTTLAFLDIVYLYVKCGNDWLARLVDFNVNSFLMNNWEAVCKAYPFAVNFVSQMSRWMIVATATDGSIAARCLDSVPRRCTVSRAKAIIMSITVLLVCVNIHYFWTYELVNEVFIELASEVRCTYANGHQQSEFLQQQLLPILGMAVGEVLPAGYLIVCSILMFRFYVRQRRSSGGGEESSAGRLWCQRYLIDPGAVEDLVVTFFALCLLCLVLTLPSFVRIVFVFVVEKYDLIETSTDEFVAKDALVQTVFDFCVYAFCSGKVVVYFTTSKRFRRECHRLLRGCSGNGGRETKDEGSRDLSLSVIAYDHHT